MPKLTRLPVLLALALAGCNPPPTPVAPSAAPTATPAGTIAAPTAAPAATPTPTAAPTATPVPTADPAVVTTATVRGEAYDVAGLPVTAGSVTITSLEAVTPFTVTVPIVGGKYRATGLPAAVNMGVVGSRPGGSPRRRVASFKPGAETVISFGSIDPVSQEDAAPFFLPVGLEVAATTPAAGEALADPKKVLYVLELSRPLDELNRRRFEQALRIAPASSAAAGFAASAPLDLAEREAADYPLAIVGAAVAPFMLAVGSVFRKGVNIRSRIAWDEAGQRATFTFAAPLPTAKVPITYQVFLVAGNEPIRDTSGGVLGTPASGKVGGVPEPGQVILSAFGAKTMSAKVPGGLSAGTVDARWAATHDQATTFEVPADKTAPKPVDFVIEPEASDTRLVITFSESLVAFDATDNGFTRAGFSLASDLQNFSFVVGKKRGDTLATELDGKDDPSETRLDPRAQATFGQADDQHVEFRFDPAAFVTKRADAAVGSVVMETELEDPTRLIITIVGRKDFFHADAHEVRLRVEGVMDPAGNLISGGVASSQTLTAEL